MGTIQKFSILIFLNFYCYLLYHNKIVCIIKFKFFARMRSLKRSMEVVAGFLQFIVERSKYLTIPAGTSTLSLL